MARKVLIVEDDSNIAELLHLYLEKEGFETAVAGDGGKGLNQSVALAKAGAAVCHAGCVGQGGGMLRQTLESYGVDTAYLKETETLQGNAVIQVDRAYVETR